MNCAYEDTFFIIFLISLVLMDPINLSILRDLVKIVITLEFCKG